MNALVNNPQRKKCVICLQIIDLSRFGRDRWNVDGKGNTCKKCLENQRNGYVDKQFCKKCNSVKSFHEFSKNNQCPDGHNYTCKFCKRKADNLYNEV